MNIVFLQWIFLKYSFKDISENKKTEATFAESITLPPPNAIIYDGLIRFSSDITLSKKSKSGLG